MQNRGSKSTIIFFQCLIENFSFTLSRRFLVSLSFGFIFSICRILSYCSSSVVSMYILGIFGGSGFMLFGVSHKYDTLCHVPMDYRIFYFFVLFL